MNIGPIKTQRDYELALKEIDRLFNAKPNTRDGDKLGILTILVHAYEDEHYPIDFPDLFTDPLTL